MPLTVTCVAYRSQGLFIMEPPHTLAQELEMLKENFREEGALCAQLLFQTRELCVRWAFADQQHVCHCIF